MGNILDFLIQIALKQWSVLYTASVSFCFLILAGVCYRISKKSYHHSRFKEKPHATIEFIGMWEDLYEEEAEYADDAGDIDISDDDILDNNHILSNGSIDAQPVPNTQTSKNNRKERKKLNIDINLKIGIASLIIGIISLILTIVFFIIQMVYS